MTFSEYFQTLKGMTVEGAQIVADKTKKVASVAKANLAIRNEEDKVRKAQMELGKLFYRSYIAGEEPDMDVFLPWCEKISLCKIAIDDLKDTIEELKSKGETDEDEFVVEVVTNEETCDCGCHGDHEQQQHHHHHHHDHHGHCCCGHDHEEEVEEEVADRRVKQDRDLACGCQGGEEEVQVDDLKDSGMVICEYEEEAMEKPSIRRVQEDRDLAGGSHGVEEFMEHDDLKDSGIVVCEYEEEL